MRQWINVINEALKPSHARPLIPSIGDLVISRKEREIALMPKVMVVTGYYKVVGDNAGAPHELVLSRNNEPVFARRCRREEADLVDCLRINASNTAKGYRWRLEAEDCVSTGDTLPEELVAKLNAENEEHLASLDQWLTRHQELVDRLPDAQ